MKITRTWNRDNIAQIETLFHTANGYLGVRNAPEEGHVPGSIRGAYINAFHEIVDIHHGEKLFGFPETKQTIANVPDAQTIRLTLNGKSYAMLSDETADREQTVDTETGLAVRSSVWMHPDGAVRVIFTRMASFEIPNLFLLRLRVESVDYDGTIAIESTLNGDVTNYANADDPRVAAEPLRCLTLVSSSIEEDEAMVVCRTLRSGLTVACRAMQGCSLPGGWEGEGALFAGHYEGRLRPGECVKLNKLVVYTDSLRCGDPAEEARRVMREVRTLGGNELIRRQKKFLAAWQERAIPQLCAPEPLPQALTYDLYQLLQSTGYDGVSSVAAKGLSGEGYEGHVFWDSEVYVFPFFLWTQPEKARGMLTYRWRLLPAARENARTLGMAKGALFPWRTISGGECSAFFPAGTAQYHIDADIAYAFLQYWYVTGDLAFMAEMGAEVLVETARMWLELGHMQDGEFRIDCVTGPDEYTCCVNNNFYTNAAAQYNLRGAAEVLRTLREAGLEQTVLGATGVTGEEEEAFLTAAQAMRLPRDERLGISPQDDSFLQKKPLDWKALPKTDFPLLLHYHPLFLYRHQICKQADTVLAHLLFPDTADIGTQKKSYDYYDAVTTHDSSLSVCVFATQAARLGDLARAREGFEATATLDLLDSHGNTKDGLHTASLGGAYLAMLRGFAGIRAEADGLSVDPVLPEGWEGYSLPFAFRGRSLRLTVSAGETRLELTAGEPLEVRMGQNSVLLIKAE
ncbi:MAG: glycoside hydrolase family 65 protein [Clostridia bacterium]|nr:glycoside hydrolase family 65 protein [Clostridia bacterium]